MADEDAATDATVTAPGRPTPPAAVRELGTVEPSLYDVGPEIAHGGMGRIRAARDLRLDREVAIKELLAPDGEATLRFEREALVTARLQHPGIVAIYEAGRWPSGEPFYAMKRVHGRSLKSVIGEAATLDARLALLPHIAAVADAMAYAHEQRIVHRDLKPANVLVGEFGETVVIDWGLAKDLAAADEASARVSRSSDPGLTHAGSVMGTPPYMPPEQARGEVIDERADVYAIGAMLYHLLAGVPPYTGESSQHVLAQVVAEPPEPLARRVRGLAPDLLAIVERAMARDASARYPTARELADDLRRFQTGQLVASHRYTRGELVRRFVRRHRVPIAIAGVAAIVVATGAVIGVQRIRDERDRAHAERRRAEGQRALAEQQKAVAIDRADALTIEQAAHDLDIDPLGALLSLDRVSPASPRLAAARVVAADAIARHVPTVHDVQVEDILDIDQSADGKRLAIASGDHSIYMLDLDVAEPKPRVIGRHDDRVEHVAFSRDGHALASAALDGVVHVWDLASGRVATFGTASDVLDLALSGDGARVAVVTLEARLRVFDVAAGREVFAAKGARWTTLARDGKTLVWWWGESVHVLDLATLHDRAFVVGQVTAAAASLDGKLAAFARADDTLGLIELDGGRVRSLGRSATTPIASLAFAPDGTQVASIGASGELRMWPAAGGASRVIGTQAEPSDSGPPRVEIAPDNQTALAIGKTTRLWDLATTDSVALRGPRDEVTRWQFSRDGGRVLGIAGHELWIWPAHGDERALARRPGPIHQVAYLPDGRALVADEDTVAIAGEPPLPLPAKLVGRLALTPDRATAALLGGDGVVRVLDVRARTLRELAGKLDVQARSAPADPSLTKVDRKADGTTSVHWVVRRLARAERDQKGWFDPVAISRDGATVAATGPSGGRLVLWSVATGVMRELAPGGADIEQLVFTPDGTTLVAADADGKLRLFPVAGGEPRVFTTTGPLEAIAISPDGATLASAGVDRTLRFWRLATGEMRIRKTYADVVTVVAYSPDGRWLAAGVQDRSVQLENLMEGGSLAVPRHEGYPLAIAFDPASRVILSADSNGDLELTEMAARRRTLRARGASIGGLAISPDGTHFAAACEDGIAREWTDDVPREESALRARLHRPPQ